MSRPGSRAPPGPARPAATHTLSALGAGEGIRLGVPVPRAPDGATELALDECRRVDRESVLLVHGPDAVQLDLDRVPPRPVAAAPDDRAEDDARLGVGGVGIEIEGLDDRR